MVVGTIAPQGLYTAPLVMPASSAMTLIASSAASASATAKANVTLAPKLPPVVSLADARFLEQATFGPTPASLAHLHQIGMNAWLDEQWSAAPERISIPSSVARYGGRAYGFFAASAAAFSE